MNIATAKENILKTLESIDKDKLSLLDLKTYAEILRIVSDIQEKSYLDTITNLLSNTGGFGMSIPSASELK